jgi:hypothetical protein
MSLNWTLLLYYLRFEDAGRICTSLGRYPQIQDFLTVTIVEMYTDLT